MKLLKIFLFLLVASFAIAQSGQLTGSALDTGKGQLVAVSSQGFALSTVPTSLTVGLSQTVNPAFDVCVYPSGGFSSPITFAVSGQGSGTTITFSPNPYTPPGGSAGCLGPVATVTTTGGATTGTFPLTITGTSGAIVQTVPFTLTVTDSSDFSLSGPSSLSVTQGSTATGSISITAIGGFSSAITFTTSGLPTGVSSAFGPNPATPPGQTSSVMTLTATGSATVGSSTITITGTAGALVHSITISLSVLVSGGGAPMQYAARTDWCEFGNESYAAQPWGCGTSNLAGAGASVGGAGTAWTGQSNVSSTCVTSSACYATVTLAVPDSNTLQATNFGFSLATPLALTVDFNYYASGSGSLYVSLIKDGVVGIPQQIIVAAAVGSATAPIAGQLVFYAPGFLNTDINNSTSGAAFFVVGATAGSTFAVNNVRILASVAPQGPPMIFLGLPGQLPPSPDGNPPTNGEWKDGVHCQNVDVGDNCDGVITVDPDFHENIVRCTDSVTQANGIPFSALGKSFGMGSDGKLQWWSADSKKLLITNVGGGQAMLSFSADANMYCSPSGIYSNHGGTVAIYGTAGQQNLRGSGYAFSPSNAHKLYELIAEAEDSSGCSGATCPAGNPFVCSTPGTGTCSYVVQWNVLTINDSGTPDTWSYTRTRLFNMTCVGTNCPAYANPGVQCTVGAGCNSNGFVNGGVDPTGGIDNTGTDSPNCLPYNYSAGGGTENHGWNGTTQISLDETSFTIGIGDTAQDGLPNRGACNGASATAGACTGSVFVVNYRVGKGCRVLNSLGKSIIGDWGPTGAPLNAEQGGLLQDNFVLHEGLSPLNSAIGDFSPVQSPAKSTVTGVNCTALGCVITTAKVSKMLLTETVTFYNMDSTSACLNGGPWLVTSQSTATGPFQFTVTAPAGGIAPCTAFGNDPSPSGTVSVNGLCPLSGVNGYCNNYYWETENLRVHPVLATAGQGHNASRYLCQYSAKFYTCINPLNTILTVCNLPTQTYCPLALNPFPTDQHGSPNNGGTADQTPVFLVSVCGSGVPPACPVTGYGSFWWDEILGLEDYITNSANSGDNFAKNCQYSAAGPDTSPCAYRFGHPFSTGSSPVFSAQNNLGNLDPSGRFMAVSSDWGGTTGCTDGSIPPTCTPSSANAIGSIYIYSVLSAHQ